MVDCWYRFEENFVVPDEMCANGMDTNWYTDSGSTYHITGELDKMVIRDRYNGGDQIHAANGAGMDIEHIGRVICQTPERNLMLENVLHVPSAKKNLISVHKLASNNDAFLEFHPNFFFIKDRTTKKTLLEGTCRRGLYPLPAAALKNKHVLAASAVTKPSLERWHCRLGHLSYHVIQQLVQQNKLPRSTEPRAGTICDSC